MRYLLRRISLLKDNGFTRLVALAAGGSGVAYMLDSKDSDRSIRFSIPVPLRYTLSSAWGTADIVPDYPFPSLGPSGCGNPPISFCSASSVSATDVNKEAPFKEASEPPKPCCGCLGRDTIANAAARVGPAVVNLSVPTGFRGMSVGNSIGSGTIIDDDGTILTCAHVVVDFQGFSSSSKGKVEVTLQDGRSFEGTVVNADLHADIAIVKIKSKTPLPTAKLGSSSSLRPGDWVVALGCPLSLQNTITAGIVSCVDRKSSDLGLGGMRREYLQTDCAINGGNSGGPLVNIDGEVIGVNIMKVMAADGLSFSVPIDSVSKILEHFKRNGRVVRPWLGLKMLDLNDMIVAQLKEKDVTFPDVSRGVLVPMVSPGSPAERAGFRPGDVVIEFEGRPVGSIKEVIEIMGDKVGKPMKVVVKRSKNDSFTLTVIPEEANPHM
ncbi:putative protease Do-like 14 [Cynara cardunculus var. scolymus]|uniref:putative protease Do-like 14 n=1 Tax=Cynara cardunculus var. scolymus TaxID=59895 RepID=UPI000D62B52C|nr:putative protease Do-like 14 [Cynara cardunculus var. scolymus]